MSPYLVPILIHVVISLTYLFIGLRLRHKHHSHTEDQLAWRAFLIWWQAMALNAALTVLSMLLMLLGVTSLPVLLALNLLSTLCAGLALWGLLSYLLYVFTGRWASTRWVAWFYGLFGLYLLYSVFTFVPLRATLQPWQVLIEYQHQPGGLYPVGLLILFGLPPILASLAFFTLFFRLKDRSARYRSVLITLGIFLHFGVPYIMPILLFLVGILTPQLPWWALTYRLIGVLGLLLIYFAYFPPAFIRRRFNLMAIHAN